MSERVEINPRVCGGQPVIRGTRISVPVILEQLAGGESWDSLLAGYPELTRADIEVRVALRPAVHSAHRNHRPRCGLSMLPISVMALLFCAVKHFFKIQRPPPAPEHSC